VSGSKACKVCRRPMPRERIELGLKTCTPRCSQRLRSWRNPRSRAIASVLPHVQGEPLWNDRALRARLGDLSREETSRRLTRLARANGLLICADPRYPGGVIFVGARARRPPPELHRSGGASARRSH
jgi:hypothetical protein